MSKDCVIIGAGFSGAVIARILAESGVQVEVIEKRSHIGGNAYDYQDKNGIYIQLYGPHIFHTNQKSVFNFLNQFSEWMPFRLRCQVSMQGKLTPSPFNLKTIDDYYSEEEAKNIKQSLLTYYPNQATVTILELLDNPDFWINKYANMLYDCDYSLYTAKQWGITPDKIDKSVLRRVPVRLDYEERYFSDEFEATPKEGFTKIFENMLNHPNINITLNCDAMDICELQDDEILYKNKHIPVVYTGMVDRLFQYKYGELPYRLLNFKFEEKNISSFQEVPVVAYPETPDFTRITEFSKLYHANLENTVIAYEYPSSYTAEKGSEPYYPIPNDENFVKYNKYKKEAEQYKNLYLCGRLADYQYYNMDNAILHAMDVAKIILEELSED